jgi:hypothetical protein
MLSTPSMTRPPAGPIRRSFRLAAARALFAPAGVVLVVSLLLAACDKSSSSPTRPPLATPEGASAIILGSASTAGNSAVVGSGAAAAITVTVQGTGLSTTTDPRGGYRLEGVPSGDRQLVFDTGSFSAALVVSDVKGGERIELDVSITPAQVHVQRMKRTTEVTAIDPSALSLDIAPKQWNVNYDHSSGSVTAFIRGAGFELIDPASVTLVGDAGELSSFDSSTQGNHVRSRFRKSGVLDVLEDPESGTTHTVIVRFSGLDGSGPFELTAQVLVLGGPSDDEEEEGEEDDPEAGIDLSLSIQPQKWNTNFPKSNGTVSALIRGDGWDRVDLDSVVLVGDAGEVASADVRAQGNHVRARWSMPDAWSVLEDPEPGSVHTVTVRFTVDGAAQELTDTVEINGR